ncbi:zinc finger protein 236-like [Diabrotica virgifera virgifera]|uniref:Zinc finger protein 236-like n=1 Tax=Diabrotica virgifera virgifera TaxID=50390 RepID=A0A6P7G854_DIAVI|nr:zinc finger protein 236-like [Diabrotica virgifera virgifera]
MINVHYRRKFVKLQNTTVKSHMESLFSKSLEMEQDPLSAVPSVNIEEEATFEINYMHSNDLEIPPIEIDEFGSMEDKSFYISDSELKKIKGEAIIDPTFEFISAQIEFEDGKDYLQPCSSRHVPNLMVNRRGKEKAKRNNLCYCPVCKKKFPTLLSRKIHLKKHFGKNLVTCYHCGQIFAEQISYLFHYSRHFIKGQNLQLFKCDMCLKKFRSKFQLAEHIMFAHFVDDDNGKAKKFVMNTVPLYKCKLCTKPFRHKYQLDHHYKGLTCINKQPDGVKYTCLQCPKLFDNPEALSVHTSNHPAMNRPKNRPYKCQYCLMFYYKKETWQQHILKHITSIEPILNQCEVCQVQFKKKEIFENHVNVNTLEEPYQCQACMQYFTLKCHQFTSCGKSVVTPPSDYRAVCNICDGHFISDANLTRHMQRMHDPLKPPPKTKKDDKLMKKGRKCNPIGQQPVENK